jgi:hypothetical protein
MQTALDTLRHTKGDPAFYRADLREALDIRLVPPDAPLHTPPPHNRLLANCTHKNTPHPISLTRLTAKRRKVRYTAPNFTSPWTRPCKL